MLRVTARSLERRVPGWSHHREAENGKQKTNVCPTAREASLYPTRGSEPDNKKSNPEQTGKRFPYRPQSYQKEIVSCANRDSNPGLLLILTTGDGKQAV